MRIPHLDWATSALGATLSVVCIAWALHLPSYLGVAYYTEQFLAVVLGLALATLFSIYSPRGKRTDGRLSWIDALLATGGLAVCMYVAVNYPRLLVDVTTKTPETMVLGGILLLLVLEALRRCTGWTLLAVIIFFLVYAVCAEMAPRELQGKQIMPGPLVVYLAFDPNAIFGVALSTGATVVIMFLWMGETLIRSGGGEFFIDLASAAFGHRRGGPAKICVVGSALFGTISGSAVSNVASVGVLTIPMMKRAGYSARDAGAIEAVGSTGGQMMPPVMGAAAFLMAEFLEVPYAKVAVAAAIPAVLYYLALYFQVDLIAGKARLDGRLADGPNSGEVIKRGWHIGLPFAVLFVTLFHLDMDPAIGGIITAVTILAIGMVRGYGGHRIRPADILRTLAATGRSSTELFITLAAAGIVIGVLNVTGLGFALTLWLVELARQNLLLLLMMAAVVGLVLGMGMPTTAVYVLLAALVAPSIVEAGVPKLAAHMFVLYFGMLSMITPPVALAAFAAASISEAGPMETAIAACRIGWAKFILPFMFVASPTLLMAGEPIQVIYDAVSAAVGIYFVTAAMVGFFHRDLGGVTRMLLTVGGIAAIVPDAHLGTLTPGTISVAGVILGSTVLFLEYRNHKQAPVT